MSDLERLAYDTALRALDKQERVLEELRARTGVLLAAASLTASVFGSRALDDFHPLGVGITAAVAVLVSLGSCLFVLVPRKGFVFALTGPGVYEELYEFKDDAAELHRRLAYDLQRFWECNDRRFQAIFDAFRLAVAGLVVEIGALGVLATGTL